jgi:hypothetical protein
MWIEPDWWDKTWEFLQVALGQLADLIDNQMLYN